MVQTVQLKNPTTYDNFPKDLDLESQETLTQLSFSELFQKAARSNNPEYLIAVTRTVQNETNFFHIFDAIYFEELSTKSNEELSTKSNEELSIKSNPINKLPIQEITYLALKCFVPKEDEKANLGELNDQSKFELHPISDLGIIPNELIERAFKGSDDKREIFKKMILDGVNHDIWEREDMTDKEFESLKRIQTSVGTIFELSKIQELKEMSKRWLICSKYQPKEESESIGSQNQSKDTWSIESMCIIL